MSKYETLSKAFKKISSNMFLAKRIFFIRNFTTCSQVLRQQAKPKDAPKDKNVFFHDAYNINYKKLQINDKELSSLILMV